MIIFLGADIGLDIGLVIGLIEIGVGGLSRTMFAMRSILSTDSF